MEWLMLHGLNKGGVMKEALKAVLLAVFAIFLVVGCGGGSGPADSTPLVVNHRIVFPPIASGPYCYYVYPALYGGKIVGVSINGVDAEIDPADVVRIGFYWQEGDSGGSSLTSYGDPAYLPVVKFEHPGIWGFKLRDGRRALMKIDRIEIVGRQYSVVGDRILILS